MMEEEVGQPFFFTGRWRGRKLWILICVSFVAAALVFGLVWINPSSDSGAKQAALPQQEAAQPQAGIDTGGDQAQEPVTQDGEKQPTIAPEAGGSAPGMVVEFPDPAGYMPDAPPDGYRDIHGRWVLDMSGSAYGLTNCHIILNEDGTVSSPPDYDQVFHIAASSYDWQAGDPAFSASLQLMLKMGSGEVLIPVQVDLEGDVMESMAGITGNFTAQPQGDAYAPYAQQGSFIMHR